MALSQQERRQWIELERQLVAEAPRSHLPVMDRRSTYHLTSAAGVAGSALALVVVLVAFTIVLLAVVVKILLIGVLGFVLMIIGGTESRFPRPKNQPVDVPGRTARREL